MLVPARRHRWTRLSSQLLRHIGFSVLEKQVGGSRDVQVWGTAVLVSEAAAAAGSSGGFGH